MGNSEAAKHEAPDEKAFVSQDPSIEDLPLRYLAATRRALGNARYWLACLGDVKHRYGGDVTDIENADDELREFDAGLERAEKRRQRDIKTMSALRGAR